MFNESFRYLKLYFFIVGCVFKDILIFDYIYMYRVVIGVSLLLRYIRFVCVVFCFEVVIVILLSFV